MTYLDVRVEQPVGTLALLPDRRGGVVMADGRLLVEGHAHGWYVNYPYVYNGVIYGAWKD